MEVKVIISYLIDRNSNQRKYNKLSVIELCYIRDFIMNNFTTERGNWSMKKVDDFCEIYEWRVHFILSNVRSFYKEYSKRKKVVKKIENFIAKLTKHERILTDKRHGFNKKTLSLKPDKDIKVFLSAMKDFKQKYFVGSDDILIEILALKIKTGYSKSTLRNYYYNS